MEGSTGLLGKDLGRRERRSILVVATSDQPAMLRMKCPLVATTIAEYFRTRAMMYCL